MLRTHRLRGDSCTTVEGGAGVELPADGEHVWYCAEAPTADEVALLVRILPIHELAMEDALTEGHPPKLEDYEDHLFLIAHTPGRDADGRTHKIAVFLGKTWIASVSRVTLQTPREVEVRLDKEPKRFLGAPERVAHALLDHMVDGFEHEVDDCVDETEALEAEALYSPSRDTMARILEARRRVAMLGRVIRSQRDVCQILSRTNHLVLSKKIAPYLRDVYDHCLRVHDLVESARDSLSAVRDGYLSVVNNRLAETMRVLTVIATIMMPLNLVAAVWGMNFDWMPLLHTGWGFWAAVLLMVAVAGGMLRWFRGRRWI
jgi:magnesium transporter